MERHRLGLAHPISHLGGISRFEAQLRYVIFFLLSGLLYSCPIAHFARRPPLSLRPAASALPLDLARDESYLALWDPVGLGGLQAPQGRQRRMSYAIVE